MLDLAWRQWSLLGVYSDFNISENRIIDPEALILFTAEAGRYDARLYDEALSWLVENEEIINVQRMQNIMKADGGGDESLVAAVSSVLARNNRSAKWKKMADKKSKKKTPLFLSLDGGPLPVRGEVDEDFARRGWLRPELNLRKLSARIEAFRVSNLVIRLRYLFGINLRAELIAYLLTHETGNPTEISKKIYYSQPTVRQACAEFERSGMARLTPNGKEIKIALDQKRWSDFLKLKSVNKIRWLNWAEIFKAFNTILRFLESRDWSLVSDYIQISESNRLMKSVLRELVKNNIRLLANDGFSDSSNGEADLKKCVETVLKLL